MCIKIFDWTDLFLILVLEFIHSGSLYWSSFTKLFYSIWTACLSPISRSMIETKKPGIIFSLGFYLHITCLQDKILSMITPLCTMHFVYDIKRLRKKKNLLLFSSAWFIKSRLYFLNGNFYLQRNIITKENNGFWKFHHFYGHFSRSGSTAHMRNTLILPLHHSKL